MSFQVCREKSRWRAALALVLALLPLLHRPQAFAQQGPWASQAQLDENRARLEAWRRYQQGMSEKNSKEAIQHFLAAREAWPEDGLIELFEELKTKQGLRWKYRLVQPSSVRFEPQSRVFEHLETMLEGARASAAAARPPRGPRVVEAAFAELSTLVDRLILVSELPASLLASLRRRVDDAQARLLAEPAESEAIPELVGDTAKKDARSAEAGPPRDSDSKTESELAEMRLRLKLTQLQSGQSRARRGLRDGVIEASLALIDSSREVLSDLQKFESLSSESWGEIAMIQSELELLQGRGLAMRRLSRALGTKSGDSALCASLGAGLEAARQLSASAWARQVEIRAALQMLREARDGRASESELQMASALMREDLARAILEEGLRASRQAYPSPDAPQFSDPQSRVTARLIRIQIRLEEAWEARQSEASPEQRDFSLREIWGALRSLEELGQVEDLSALEPATRAACQQAREACVEELLAIVTGLFERDRSFPSRRLALLLIRADDLALLFEPRAEARFLVSLGLAIWSLTGSDSGRWLSARALELWPEVLDSLPAEIPRALKLALRQQAAEPARSNGERGG
jgi:hypothetical protein